MSTENTEDSRDLSGRILDSTVISRSPSVLAATVQDEIVMMSIERGSYFGLDDIGSDIWQRIEPPCSFGALIDALAADYEADRVTIATDVRVLLDRMAAQDVVKLG
jgi:coenzyme PQQ synthesis protein D (PqqD)